MSTRRTTRAGGSRAASSAASPAPTGMADIPQLTPGRTTRRRPGNASLPATAAVASSSYGDNTLPPAPRNQNFAATNQSLNAAMETLLQPQVNPNPTPTRPSGRGGRAGSTATTALGGASRTGRGRSQTPAARRGNNAAATPPSRSFNDESSIFGQAGIESSIIDPNDLSNIPEDPEDNDSDDYDDPMPSQVEVQRRQLEQVARQNHIVAQQARKDLGLVPKENLLWRFANNLTPNYDFLKTASKSSLFKIVIGLIVLYLLSFLPSLLPSAWPFSVGPSVAFDPHDANAFDVRLRTAEGHLSQIEKQIHGVNFKAIKDLERDIPDFVVVKKGKNRKLTIPDNLWGAIKNKIESDESLASGGSDAGSGKQSSGSIVSEKQVKKIVHDKWDQWFRENQAKVGKMMDAEFIDKFPQWMKDSDVIRKSEFIDLITENWNENSQKFTNDLGELSRKVERLAREVKQGSTKMSGGEMKTLVDEVTKHISKGQLKGIARHNLEVSYNFGASGPNHFNRNLGATISPLHTSPTWQPEGYPTKASRWIHQLVGNPPPMFHDAIEVLRRWEESGDCWCAATRDKERGAPLSFQVSMGASVQPSQIVVEHLPQDESYEPGSAPKDMQLFAYLPDKAQYDAVKSYSDKVFGQDRFKAMDNFVKIGTWQYEAGSPQNIQIFRVQVNLKDFDAHTSRVVVRSTDNWGDGKVPFTCIYRVRLHGPIADVGEHKVGEEA